MAVNPTGAIYKTLNFDGQSSGTYGVYITGDAVFNAPERDVEMVKIPGRNGAFALDNGRFENIEVTYPAGIFAETEADFAAAISDFRNYLCSRKGYCRLTDDYNPDEYRLGIYKSGLEVDPALLKAGQFNITFECKPQRYLTTGENPITVTDGDTLTNPTYFESGPLLEVEGYGDIDFNGFNITLEDGSYGRITLLENNDFRPLTPTNPFIYTQKFDRRYVAVGDELTLNDWQESKGLVKFYGVAYLKGNFGFDSSIYKPDVRSSEWSYISNNIQNVGVARRTSPPSYLLITATVNPLNLYVGTPSTFNASATFTFPIIKTSDDTPTGQNAQITLSIGIDYDGNDTITTTFNRTIDNDPFSIFEGIVNDPEDSSYWNRLKLSSVIADSTETYLGHPTYVDCDLGEAYKVENGEVISLNAYIDLGSDLPELAPGSNTITFDNTVTDLKITPRWWKV